MDAKYYTGDDDRDSLTETEEGYDCLYCEAGPDEPCLVDCACRYCIAARARIAASLLTPKDAA